MALEVLATAASLVDLLDEDRRWWADWDDWAPWSGADVMGGGRPSDQFS